MQARHFWDSAVKPTNKHRNEFFVTFGDTDGHKIYLWRQHKNKSQTDCVEEREANAIKGNVTVPVERNNLFLISCKLQSYPSVQAQEAHIEARQVLLASWAVNEIQIFDSNFSSGTSKTACKFMSIARREIPGPIWGPAVVCRALSLL